MIDTLLNTLQLILFDLDDTLFDFFLYFERGMRATMRVHPATQEIDSDLLYQRFMHHSDALWPQQIAGEMSFQTFPQMRLIHALREFDIAMDEQGADEFIESFNEKYLEVIEPTPTTQALIARLAERYQLGIVTNGASDTAYQKVVKLGLDRYFAKDAIFVSEVVGYSKPHPLIFETVLRHFDVAPQQTLFVGDNWTADVVGAMNAGMAAVWLNAKKQQPTTAHQPIAILEDLQELEVVIANMEKAWPVSQH